MTEEKKLCGKSAIYYVSWAGKQVPCCQEHTDKIQAVGNAIGCPAEAVVNSDPASICTSVVED